LLLQFSPFPELKTSRLILRQLSAEDQNQIFFLRSDETVNKYVDRPRPSSVADAMKHIDRLNNGINKNELINWGITLAANPSVIGTIGLWNISKTDSSAEVGFELAPEFQRKGIMAEAFLAVSRYAFETMKVRKLLGWVHVENIKSLALLRKFNFMRDPEEEKKAIGLNDMVIYTLDSTAWRSSLPTPLTPGVY
jgi:ribosomal-protein-alanine N-acetyltransferase